MDKEFIKEHWVIVTSVLLFLFSILGFIYSSIYFDRFGINYLEYAEVGDLISVLLIHPKFLFNMPYSILGLLVLLSLPTAFDFADKFGAFKNTFEKVLTLVFFLVAALLFINAPFQILSENVSNIKERRANIYEVVYGKNSEVIKCLISDNKCDTHRKV